MYLLNCLPLKLPFSKRCFLLSLHPWKYQEQCFVSQQYRWKDELFYIHSFKTFTSLFSCPVSWSKLPFLFQESHCLFVFIFYYYLFKCFCVTIISFRDLNSAISLSVENTRNSFFSSEQDTLCHYWIKKNDFKPWVTYRTNIIFLRVITSNLTGLRSSVARYRGHNEKGSSIFTRNHELFCLLDKHYSPLLAKKVDYTKKWEFDIPSSPWQSGAKGEWRVSSWLAI